MLNNLTEKNLLPVNKPAYLISSLMRPFSVNTPYDLFLYPSPWGCRHS